VAAASLTAGSATDPTDPTDPADPSPHRSAVADLDHHPIRRGQRVESLRQPVPSSGKRGVEFLDDDGEGSEQLHFGEARPQAQVRAHTIGLIRIGLHWSAAQPATDSKCPRIVVVFTEEMRERGAKAQHCSPRNAMTREVDILRRLAQGKYDDRVHAQCFVHQRTQLGLLPKNAVIAETGLIDGVELLSKLGE
jgi:hypothetical protein